MVQPPILMYHGFRPSGQASTSLSPQLEITPELFAKQMALLSARGYETMSLTEAFTPDTVKPRKPIVITFDDGTLDFWEYGREIMQQHGFTATLFVVTRFVGTESSWEADVGEPARPLMTWKQLKTLADEGFEIGSHTHTHRELPQLTADEVTDELTTSRRVLEEQLGTTPQWIAYPRGRYEKSHKTAAAAAGYTGACAVALEYRDLAYGDRFELKRVTIKSTESMLKFRLRTMAAHHVRYKEYGDGTF